MCTVSWIHQGDGYQLLCNRDELHTRKPALPPSVHQRGDARFIAPIDGDHGGSWIGVNQFGLSLCLLNRWEEGEQARTRARISRGVLLVELMNSATRAEVRNRILGADLSRFEPFTLAALQPQREVLIVHWTGSERVIDADGERAMPLTSSSYDPAGAVESRKRHFVRLVTGSDKAADRLFGFHASHEPAAGPYSTCMHRDDARTVSFSWIKVAADRIDFCYHPHSPCLLWTDAGRASTEVEISRTPYEVVGSE